MNEDGPEIFITALGFSSILVGHNSIRRWGDPSSERIMERKAEDAMVFSGALNGFRLIDGGLAARGERAARMRVFCSAARPASRTDRVALNMSLFCASCAVVLATDSKASWIRMMDAGDGIGSDDECFQLWH